MLPAPPTMSAWSTYGQWSPSSFGSGAASRRGKELDRLEGGSTVAYAVVSNEFDPAENGALEIVWAYQ
ncbi:hypothetical protein ACFV84_36205 [Kitasatospora sp. NPDC059811]|uniref:hypothetical protein n=1 Tax=Streptomycetaceae TaxID=2062 RepID=UPI000AAB29E3|nr:hypothetical protein [Streptomyces sp. MJM8645]